MSTDPRTMSADSFKMTNMRTRRACDHDIYIDFPRKDIHLLLWGKDEVEFEAKMLAIFSHLRRTSSVQEVHIKFCPSISTGFTQALKCLQTLVDHLARVLSKTCKVAFDFTRHAPAEVLQILDSMKPLAGLPKQVCMATRNWPHPKIGRGKINIQLPSTQEEKIIIRNMMRECSVALVKKVPVSALGSSRLSALPFELQSMILSHLVVTERPLPLNNGRPNGQRSFIGSDGIRYLTHCCGHCRGHENSSGYVAEICRCSSLESYSTSCRCVWRSDSIFSVSKDLRAEALRLYWSQNTFYTHEHVRLFEKTLNSITPDSFRTIKHLQIQTPLQLIGGEIGILALVQDTSTQWRRVMAYLEANQGPQLQLHIKVDGIVNDIWKTWGKMNPNKPLGVEVTSLVDHALKRNVKGVLCKIDGNGQDVSVQWLSCRGRT